MKLAFRLLVLLVLLAIWLKPSPEEARLQKLAESQVDLAQAVMDTLEVVKLQDARIKALERQLEKQRLEHVPKKQEDRRDPLPEHLLLPL